MNTVREAATKFCSALALLIVLVPGVGAEKWIAGSATGLAAAAAGGVVALAGAATTGVGAACGAAATGVCATSVAGVSPIAIRAKAHPINFIVFRPLSAWGSRQPWQSRQEAAL